MYLIGRIQKWLDFECVRSTYSKDKGAFMKRTINRRNKYDKLRSNINRLCKYTIYLYLGLAYLIPL